MFDGAEFVARVAALSMLQRRCLLSVKSNFLFFVKDEGEKESFLAKVQ
jgi:hypothetical protein